MQFYVFTPGSPGYISAEVAVRELPTGPPDEARAWAEDSWSHHWLPYRIVSRSEALMVPLYHDALERWERGDDGVLQATETAEVLESRRSEAAGHADLGCSIAAAALASRDDEAIRVVINEHCHDERCGGRNFPDEPKSRALQVVT
jgi:hypothetical protein